MCACACGFSPQTDSQALTGTNSSAIVRVYLVDPWTNLGEEIIELAFIQPEITLEPSVIKAELLNQPVKFSVEMLGSQYFMDPDGPTTTGLRFHRKFADATQRRLPKVRSMVEEGTDVIDGLLYRPMPAA